MSNAQIHMHGHIRVHTPGCRKRPHPLALCVISLERLFPVPESFRRGHGPSPGKTGPLGGDRLCFPEGTASNIGTPQSPRSCPRPLPLGSGSPGTPGLIRQLSTTQPALPVEGLQPQAMDRSFPKAEGSADVPEPSWTRRWELLLMAVRPDRPGEEHGDLKQLWGHTGTVPVWPRLAHPWRGSRPRSEPAVFGPACRRSLTRCLSPSVRGPCLDAFESACVGRTGRVGRGVAPK